MAKHIGIPVWKSAPFLRLVPPFIIGVLLQWHFEFHWLNILVGIGCFAASFILFTFLRVAIKYKLQLLNGILLNFLIISIGTLITWQNDIRNSEDWYGNIYRDSSFIVATINEPVITKERSFKADAAASIIIHNKVAHTCQGKLLLYFSKDCAAGQLHYGDRIIFSKQLQPIRNSGNPGAFDYVRYASFQQVFHNVFLKDGDWIKLEDNDGDPFHQFIYAARERILSVLRKNISGGKDELGIAEALLVGYTNDLDKDLVQAYSNTGVVHIIAISGMHLALIYGLLVFIFSKIPFINKLEWLQALLIISCLWTFSLMTGGAASVLRSAVMFTFITTGKYFSRKASIYNSLAASAFVMLCYDPYFLWDAGFQLSYLAVAGIVTFQKPVYNVFYIKNKWLDTVWKATALTTSAQLLTFPVCIYYFHQFPLLFLFTNLIAVPLSTIILYAEIFLAAFSWIPFTGIYAGRITGSLLGLMNKFILVVNQLPFAVWDRIPATVTTTWLLYAIVIFSSTWLIHNDKKMLQWMLACLAGFILLQAVIRWEAESQQKIIVYNVQQHQAIDFIQGTSYQFVGDSILLRDGLLQNFHLKPGRITLQLNKQACLLPGLVKKDRFYLFGGKKILLIDEPVTIASGQLKIPVDIIILSKNTKLPIGALAKVFSFTTIVFDASNSLWKIANWKEECDELNLRYYSIPEQGAFTLDL